MLTTSSILNKLLKPTQPEQILPTIGAASLNYLFLLTVGLIIRQKAIIKIYILTHSFHCSIPRENQA